jgi:hypothetical protein
MRSSSVSTPLSGQFGLFVGFARSDAQKLHGFLHPIRYRTMKEVSKVA